MNEEYKVLDKSCFLDCGPLISIVVPVYNMEKYLCRCVDSILNQTYRNLEIILVDDCSTDKSPQLIKEYLEQDDRIKTVRHEKNRGLFQARITGSLEAHGKYLAFVDSDDYISIDWYRMLLKKAEQCDSDITVGEWCFDNDGKSKTYLNLDPFRIRDYDLKGTEIADAFMEQEGDCFSWTVVWNKLYRKELWDACLPDFIQFSNQHGHMIMWEDIAFSSALWLNASHVTNVHGINYFYFRHKNASTSIKKNKIKNLKYINDASAAMTFFEANLKKKKNSKYFKYFTEWNAKAAGILYRDLVENLGNGRYESLIRKAFQYSGSFEKQETLFYSLSSNLHQSFFWEEDLKRSIISPKNKIVSFDVFDTLIQRPFLYPTDLFSILSDELNRSTSSYIDFVEIRIEAEKMCRRCQNALHPSAEEVTLEQIYQKIRCTCSIPESVIHRLEIRERELEIEFCKERKIGKELFELANEAGKSIIICSDMYLDLRTVETILSKNGYTKYKKLYLSSEIMVTKHRGALYRHVKKDLLCKNTQEILHIGDSWVSDVENAEKNGWQSAHLSKATDLLQNQNPGIYSGRAFCNIYGPNNGNADNREFMKSFTGLRNVLGLVANKLFASPFVSINPESDFNGNPAQIGYGALGPHLLSVGMWIEKMAKERKIPTVHFVARDGYLPKKAFDILNQTNTKSNYLRLSRKALLLADINMPEDLYSILRKVNVLDLSPKKLTKYLEPLVPDEKATQVQQILSVKKICFDRVFGSITEYEQCLKVLIDEVLDFTLLPKYKKQLRDYFSRWIKPGDYIFDIGYSGRPEAALSNILGFPVGSLYIHVNSEIAEKRQLQHHCPSATFYGYKPSITGVMREHLLMELGPSTIGYETIGGQLAPIFEPYEETYSSRFVTEVMQEAAIEFIQDYCKVYGSIRQNQVLPLEALSAPFEYYLHYSKEFDRLIFASLTFEDGINGAEEISAFNFWNQELINHGLGQAGNVEVGFSSELAGIYVDGVLVKFYVKLYKWINKHFPKGGKARNVIKKFAGFFLK